MRNIVYTLAIVICSCAEQVFAARAITDPITIIYPQAGTVSYKGLETLFDYNASSSPYGDPVNSRLDLYKGDVLVVEGWNTFTGDYSITVPENVASGDDYRVKFYDLNNPLNYGWSGYFTILENRNTIKRTIVREEGVTDEATLTFLPVSSYSKSVIYFDNLSRSEQVLQVNASPLQNDIVLEYEYDLLGRQSKTYLPLVSDSESDDYVLNVLKSSSDTYTGSLHYNYYNVPGNLNQNITADASPYAQVTYEASPRKRMTKLSGTGEAWQTAYTNNSYGINTSSGGSLVIQKWTISNGLPVSSAIWPAGELRSRTVSDPASSYFYTATNVEGIELFKREQKSGSTPADTYYVYDYYRNNLRFIIPPALTSILSSAGSYQPTQDQVDRWCYQYEYDAYNRAVAAKGPGTGWIYAIYDSRGRIVLTQDANQRASNQWRYVKYDDFDRPVISGLYTASSSVSRVDMQLTVDALNSGKGYENVTSSYDETTTTGFPSSGIENLSVWWYDSYTGNDALFLAPEFAFVSETWNGGAVSAFTSTTNVKGQVTASTVKVLGSSNTWMKSVLYYDKYQHPIQHVTSSASGSINRFSGLYDFTGNVLETLALYAVTTAGSSARLAQRHQYDHAGRLLNTWHRVNQEPEILLVSLEYNELGELITKKIHSTDAGASYLQATDYSHNIRGWLTGINNEPQDNDYFSMSFAYETDAFGTGATIRKDGLISATRWTDAPNSTVQAYNYTYNNYKNLQHSVYKTNPGTGWVTGNEYSERDITYDLNGNIKSLNRWMPDPTSSTGSVMDQLTYSYGSTGGNMLMSVTDAAAASVKENGFNDGNATGDDYSYDANGNLTLDKNKGITAITYNHLNLPVQVTFSDNTYIQYLYNAGGEKLRQAYYNASAQLVLKTDYNGELIYRNNTLTQILTSEGHYLLLPGETAGSYYYYLTDHLGSPRVVLQSEPDTNQANATLETAQQASEQSVFLRYDNVRKINSILFDHTHGAGTGYSQRLNGTENERYGLAKSLSVLPGDTVKLEVFAKYVDTNSANWTTALNTLLTQIAGGTAPAGTVLDGATYTTSTSSFQFGGLLNTSGSSGEGPKAYLNWLIFDRDFNYMDGGFVQLSDAPREYGQDTAHERLSAELVIAEAGYVYAYLSNENETPVEVYFDDFSIEHIESPVVQVAAYYPYGLTAYSQVREDEQFTNYLFQGKQYDSLTQWHNFHARQYDGTLGRFWTVDPANQFASGFIGMGNNPVMIIDPDGQKAWWVIVADVLTGGALSLTAVTTGTTLLSTAVITGSTLLGTAVVTGSTLVSTATATYATLQHTIPAVQSAIAITDFSRSITQTSINIFKDIVDSDDHIYEDDSWIFDDLIKTFKIEAGLFLHIPGWETDQTLLGNAASHFRNIMGDVDNVEINNGAVLVNNNTSNPNDGWWGFTLGPYINSQNIETSDDAYSHEYGHTIQSRILGPRYLSAVAIPSFYTNTFTSHDNHAGSWYEVWASRLGGAANHQQDYRHNNFAYWFKIIMYPFYPN